MECKISVKAGPTTWLTVDDDGPADFNTIQEAINNATEGDTIYVYNGTYYENLIVNKTVSLVGENSSITIIDGNGTDSVISITANNVSIEDFTIRGSGTDSPYNSGIFIEYSSGNDITRNVITENYAGVTLRYSSLNVISCNTILLNNYGGFFFYQSSNENTVSRNVITENHGGVTLFSSSLNVISGNIISLNNYEGRSEGIIFYQSSNENTVSRNVITENYAGGASLYYSSLNVISENIISLNNYGEEGGGIIFASSENNVVSRNTITDNHEAVNLDIGSSNNNFYFNNFNNTVQVVTGSTNVWDDGNEGNYWSDYNGTDVDQDGIGDTPYSIDGNNRDNYPLMGMFSDFNITLQGKTYYVATVCNSTISDFTFGIGQETGNKIVRFTVTGKDSTVGFCRIMIPTELMNHPYIVLIDAEEIVPTKLNISSQTYTYLYFTYVHDGYTITIISSKTLHLYYELLDNYYELLDKYNTLETDLYNLNATYHDFLSDYFVLLSNFSELQISHLELNSSYYSFLSDYFVLLSNFSELQISHLELNSSYYSFLSDYFVLLSNFSELQISHLELNSSYYSFLSDYFVLLSNFSELQISHLELNSSYQEHLSDYSQNLHNIRNLIYISAATTAIFIITTVYLSKNAHASKTKILEEAEKKRTL